jgi:hypothetical protein
MPTFEPKSIKTSTAHMLRQPQALDRLAVFEVALNDLVDIVRVHKRVPNSLWVNHCDWPARAAIEAARFVDPHLALAAQARLLDRELAAVKARLGLVLRAAVFAVGALIEAKKDVARVVRGAGFAHEAILWSARTL